MTVSLEIADRTESGYLTPEEERNERELFAHLTDSIIYLGDPDYRRVTEADAGVISNVVDAVTQAAGLPAEEKTRALQEALQDGFSSLEDVISGGGGHTLLGKVLGIIAYCDLATTHNAWPSNFSEFFNDVLQTEYAYGDRIILTAALYARLAYHWLEKYGSDYLEELDDKMIGLVNSRDAAINKLRIHVAARALSEMLSEDKLRMRLPWTIVTSNETADILYVSREGGFPDTIMHLHEGFYPTFNKLEEAVKYGMPEVRRGLINRRMPRLLASVHVTDASGLHRQKRNTLKTAERKRFIYMYLRGVRGTRLYDGGDEREDCTYDTLSLIGAVRISRALKDEQSVSMDELNDEIDDYIGRLTDPVIEIDGHEHSIVSVGLSESQQIDGTEGWSIAEATARIRRNITYLLVRHQVKGFSIRGEDDILAMYRRHIWDTELTHEDKFELACALLSDPDCPCWNQIPTEDQPELAQAVHNGKPLDRTFEEFVIENCELERLIDIRCETIRDTLEPETLRDGTEQI